MTLRALSFRLLWGRGRLSRLWWRLQNLGRCWRQGRGLYLSCLLRLGEGRRLCWLGRWSLSLCRRIGDPADLIHSEQILLLLLSLLKLRLDHCLLFLRLPDLLLDRRLLSGLGGRWCSQGCSLQVGGRISGSGCFLGGAGLVSSNDRRRRSSWATDWLRDVFRRLRLQLWIRESSTAWLAWVWSLRRGS